MLGACDQFRERLVDFADGELSADEAQAVAAHLQTCPACRAQVARLQKSLALAQDVWQQQAAQTSAGPRHRSAPWPLRVGRWGLPAAALLIAFGVWQWRYRAAPPVEPAAGPGAPQPASADDVEHEIAQSVFGAQLLAAADVLAEVPGGQPYACQRYAYVADTYANTVSATAAQQRLDEVCNRRIEP